eukprot:SAG11_NODE_3632_length_2323_cov_2.213129_2_plen_315_part_00
MSDFTVGKIANNSVTLLLNSEDGEKQLAGTTGPANDVALTDAYLGSSAVISALGATSVDGAYVANNLWFDSIRGLTTPTVIEAPTVVVGEYWVITANGGYGGTRWVGVVNNISTNALNTALGVHGDGVIVEIGTSGTLGAGQQGYKLHTQASDVGKSFVIKTVGIDGFTRTLTFEDHTNFKLNIPNIISYPNKSRCLIQVNGVYFHRENAGKINLFVKIPELTPFNYIVGAKQGTGVLGAVYADDNTSSKHHNIIDNGVLCQTPFGKRLSVSLEKGLTNPQTFNNTVTLSHPFIIELMPFRCIKNTPNVLGSAY